MHNRRSRLAHLAIAFSLTGAVAAGMPVSALAGQTKTVAQEQKKESKTAASGKSAGTSSTSDKLTGSNGTAASNRSGASANTSGTSKSPGTDSLSVSAESEDGESAAKESGTSLNLKITADNFYDSSDMQGKVMSRQEKKVWKNWVVAQDKVQVFNNKKEQKAIGTLEKGAGALILDEDKDGYQIKADRQIAWVKKSDKLLTGQKAFSWEKVHGAVKAEMNEAGVTLYNEPDEKSSSYTGIQKIKAVVDNLDSIDLLTPDLSDYTTSAAWVAMNVQGKTMYAKSSDVVTGFDIAGITPAANVQSTTTASATGTQTGSAVVSNDSNSDNREEVFSISLTGKCAADVYSYMGWRCITSRGSVQYKLLSQFESYDSDGFGKIGDRYVIATTTTFGEIGDLVDFTLANGQVIHAIIGDHKNMSDPGCNMWGHQKGHCVVEFVVNKAAWYGTSKTPTGFHSEWASRAVKATNYGNIWDGSHTDYAAKAEKALAHIRALEANGGEKATPTEEELKAKKEAKEKKKAEEKKKKEEEKKKKEKEEKLKKEKAEKEKKAKEEKLQKEKAEKAEQQKKEAEEKEKQQKEEEARQQAEKEKQQEQKKKEEEQRKKEEEAAKEAKEKEKQKENSNASSENENSATEETGTDSSAPAE